MHGAGGHNAGLGRSVPVALSVSTATLTLVLIRWTGKMIGLPSEFACFGEGSKGGGVIQVRDRVSLLHL